MHVLATIDESTYDGGGMGADHPIAWWHEYDGGRAWYTAGGHTDEAWSEPDPFDGSDTSYTLYAMAGGDQPIGLDGSALPASLRVMVDAVGQLIVIAVSV